MDDESSISKMVTPNKMPSGKRDVFMSKSGTEIAIAEPTFMKVPRKITKLTGKKRLDIVDILKTPNGCPFGSGLKAFILDGGKAKGTNIICVCAKKDYKWLQVESSQIPHMFPK